MTPDRGVARFYPRPPGQNGFAPHMHSILFPLGLLFVVCSLYAVALSTKLGQRWTHSKTWTTVVLGCALVLGALALYDTAAALTASIFFAVGGAPILVRELILEFRREQSIVNRHIGE